MNQLRVSLATRRSIRFDVSASVEEKYVEEVDLATFIQSIMVAPSLEPKVVVPSGFVPEVVLTVDAVSTPRTAATDKGKGVYARLLRIHSQRDPRGS